jgi:hypothetical protein
MRGGTPLYFFVILLTVVSGLLPTVPDPMSGITSPFGESKMGSYLSIQHLKSEKLKRKADSGKID